jgi:simple sugar transport system permease protein
LTDLAETKSSASGKAEWSHPHDHPIRRFVISNRAALGSLAVFVAMLLVFFIANPRVFSTWNLYTSVMTTLPVALFLTAPLVFVVTAGEIDLSFPAVMGLSALAFAVVVQAGIDPFIAIAAALVAGSALGFGVGALVVYGGLSSLVATLGMNFMLRGAILIMTQSKSIAMPQLADSLAFKLFSSTVFGLPVQIFWALLFIVFCALLYNRHRFGAQVHIVGDNPDSATEMGINVKLIRVKVFGLMGVGAALAGVFSTMINFTWWPTSGDGYLLPVLASVFVGGTPTWGGIGTIAGGAIGALIVSFIQTGVVGAGWSGFYIQFFYGMIIILSLLGHRWNQVRYR